MGAEDLGNGGKGYVDGTGVVINYVPPLRLTQELALSSSLNDVDDSLVIKKSLSTYLLTRTEIVGGAELSIQCSDLPNKDEAEDRMRSLLKGPLLAEDTSDAVERLKINVTTDYAEKLTLEASLLADGDVSTLVTASARFMQGVETVRMLEGVVWLIRDTEDENERWVNINVMY